MYPPCPHGNAFGHNLKWKGTQPSLLAKTELSMGGHKLPSTTRPAQHTPGRMGCPLLVRVPVLIQVTGGNSRELSLPRCYILLRLLTLTKIIIFG